MDNLQPKDNKKRNIIIVVIVVVVLILCCLVAVVVVAAGGGAAYFLNSSSKVATVAASQVITEIPLLEDTTVPEDTVAPEDTATPETVETPTDTPQVENTINPLGLGVSRDEMEQFLNAGGAFTFSKPQTIQGLEVVMGTHSSLCIQTNCAAVTLLGPADDLLAVSMAAPTDPTDIGQTTVACTLLMTLSARFSQDGSGIAMQILNDTIKAQAAQANLNETVTDNGYEFTIIYNPKTHNAGLAIARPKP